MKYSTWIFHITDIDLTEKAVVSVNNQFEDICLIDNSPTEELSQIFLGNKVYTPPFPLTFVESINTALGWSLKANYDAMVFMHNDAEAKEDLVSELLAYTQKLIDSGEAWGEVLTNYDAIAIFNMQAVRRVGLFDRNLTQYYSDNDYMRRLQLAGFPIIQSPFGDKVSHVVSATLKSGYTPKPIHDIIFSMAKEYYINKWGGDKGEEKYRHPFNL